MTIVELKAKAYDLVLEAQRVQQYLAEIQRQLNTLGEQIAKAEKEEKDGKTNA